MSRLSGGLPDIKSRPLFVTSTDRILLYVFVLVWDGIPCHVSNRLHPIVPDVVSLSS